MSGRASGRYEEEPGWVRPVFWVTFVSVALVGGTLWLFGVPESGEILALLYVACGAAFAGSVALFISAVGEFLRSLRRG